MLATAVRATGRDISICQVAWAVAKQGLLPRDFDNPDGCDALIAVALMLTANADGNGVESTSWSGSIEAALEEVCETRETPRQRRAELWRAQVAQRRRYRLWKAEIDSAKTST